MKKRMLVISFVLVFLLCTSCYDVKNINDIYENRVDFISGEEGHHYIEYLNSIYAYYTERTLIVEKCDDDVFLGWNGMWAGYKNKYYSYTDDNPIFIYETRTNSLYFRSDYDFFADTFVVNQTCEKIVYSEAVSYISTVITEKNNFDYVDISLCSETYPRLKIELDVFLHNGMWYGLNGDNLYVLSEKFVELLQCNKIIPS